MYSGLKVTGMMIVSQVVDSVGNVPCSIAYAGVIINTVDANSTVYARIRRALVDVGLAIFPRPSGEALAFIFALGKRYANTFVSARALLAKSYAELRFTVNSGEAWLARTAEISFRVFVTRATVAAGAAHTRRT